MTAWNWIAIDATDGTSHYGPGFTTREAAIQDTTPAIQKIAEHVPTFRQLALAWIRGEAKDDTVYAGPFVYGLYRYDAELESDIQTEANLWMTDFAGRGGLDLIAPQGDSAH